MILAYNSDISSFINKMNLSQRERFVSLLNEFKKEGMIETSELYRNTCTIDDIIDKVISINEYEYKNKLSEEAVKKGETTIPLERWGVHITHCCVKHGCKYGDIDCPVATKLVLQKYPCEDCINKIPIYD